MEQSMLTPSELLLLADANRAEFTREHARWLPPTAVEEHGDLLLSAAGTSFPAGPWNCAMGLGTHPSDGSALQLAKQFFFARRRGFTVYTRQHLDSALDEACERSGLKQAGDTPGMALLERTGAPALAPGVALRRVQSAD